MNFVTQILSLGVLEDDSPLKKRGKQVFNLDVWLSIFSALLAEVGLRISGHSSIDITVLLVSFVVLCSSVPFLMSRKQFGLAVFILQVACFSFLLYAVLMSQGFMVSLYFVVFAVNGFIYFPELKKLSGLMFLFFMFSFAGFITWEIWNFDLANMGTGYLIRFRIGMSIFGFLFIHKMFSVISLYWVTMDKVERSQKALTLSEMKYRSFFEKVKVGIATEKEGRFTSVNPEMSRLLGYGEDELIGMKPVDIIHPNDYPSVKKQFNEVVANPKVARQIPHRLLRKDKSILDVLVTFAPLGEEGNMEGELIVTMSNLTQIRAAEEALEETENRYRSLFENAFDGIFIYDLREQAAKHCNKKLADTLGVSRDEILTNFPDGFFPEFQPDGTSSQDLIRRKRDEVLLDGRTKFIIETLKPDRSTLTAEINMFSLPKPNSHLTVSIFRDISERQKQENIIQENIAELNQKNEDLQKYIESNLQLENFAYIASHDLKAPIRTIGSFSKLLKRKAASKLDDSELEFLEFINKGAENMSKLVEDLLTYSKANTENHQLELINMQNLLDLVIHELSVNIEENKAKINFVDIPKTIYADNTKMRQLFQNLIANAIKFKKPTVDPIITITGKEDTEFWHFSIRDNGIGIKPEFHDKIFMLFRKLHGSNEFEGSGIGLSLCKKIVEQHFGTISIDSEYGNFTCFDFSIRKS